MKNNIYLTLLLLCSISLTTWAQNNDCIDALPICTTSSQNFPSGNSGSGTADPGLNTGCATESQSSWYYFTVTTGGTLTFVIDPVNNSTDYDFALYLSPYGSPANPATNCDGSNELGAPVRCNFSATTGNTGLSTTASNSSEGASGPSFSSALTVTTGQVYYIMINNYSGDGYPFAFSANTGNTAVLSCTGVTAPTSPCTCTGPTCNNAFHATEAAAVSENGTVTTGTDCTLFSPVIPVEQDGSTDMTFCADYVIPGGTTLVAFTTGGQYKYVSGGTCTGSIINRSVYASGSCGSPLASTGNVTAGGRPIYAVTPGATYVFCQTIRLAGPDCLQYNSSCINVFSVPAPPANDQCAGAVAITCGTSTTGTTLNATTTNDPTGSCSGETVDAPGVWYTFTPASNQTITLDTDNATTNYDTKIHVYTSTGGCAGPFTCLAADDDAGAGTTSMVSFAATTGNTYYILVNGNSGLTGNFALDIACATVPANDNCSGAIAITCGNNYTVNNTSATTDPQDNTTCGSFTIGPTGHGVWYKLIGNGKIVTLDTDNTITGTTTTVSDTEISVWTGPDCSALSCFASDDDSGATPTLSSLLTFTAEVGTTYYILVTGHNGSTGVVDLGITCVDPAYNVGGGTTNGGTAFCNNNVYNGSTTALPTNTLVVTSPTGILRDPGGTGNYSSSFRGGTSPNYYPIGTTIICPNGGDGGTTTLTFTSFNTENGFDYVYVYDGPNYNYPQATIESPLTAGSPYTGTPTVPFSITSTNQTGCLTVEFYSDASNVAAGFQANWTSSGDTGVPLVSNDACNDAIPVGIECPTVSGTNINATASCSDPTPSFFAATTLENTVWYKFTVPAADAGATTVTLSNINCPDFANSALAAGNRGLQMGVYNAGSGGLCPDATISSGSATRVASASAAGVTTLTSTSFTTVAGNTYYIGIDGNSGASCDFDITIDRYATNFAVNSATGGSYNYSCDAAPAQTADVALTLSGGRTSGYSVTVVPNSISVTNSGSVYTLNNIVDGTTWTATVTDGLCTQIISGTYSYDATCNPCPSYSKSNITLTPATSAVCGGQTVTFSTLAVDAARSVPTIRAATLGGRKYGDGVGGTAPLNYVADYKKYIHLLPFSTMNATTIGSGVSQAQINGLDFSINAKWNDMYIVLKNTSCAGSVVIWNGVNNTAFAGGTDATVSTGTTTLSFSAATGLFSPVTSVSSYSSTATLDALNAAFSGCNPQGFYLEINDQSSSVLQYSINNLLFSMVDKTTTAITPTTTLTNIAWTGSGAATGGLSGLHTNVAQLTLSNSDKNATFTAPACAGPSSCVYTYVVTGKDVNGCTVSGTATITVNPTPVITAGLTQTICSGGTTSRTITLSNDLAGTETFAWNTPTVTGGITGGAAGTGSTIAQTLVNTTNAAQTATYTVTVTAAAADGGCTSTANVVITVNPVPVITAGLTQAICSGTAASRSITLSTDLAGTETFAWNAPTMTAGISGGVAGSGTTITDVLSNSGTTAGTATYTVTVTAAAADGGCTSTRNVVITVNPVPVITSGLTQEICSGGTTSRTITLSTDLAGAETFAWNTPTVTGGITGGAAGTGSTIANTLVNPSTSAQTATYAVTVTAAAADGGCTSTRDVVITVNPLPTVNAGSDVAICNGGSAALSASGSGGTGTLGYSWTPTATLTGAATATPTATPTTTTTYIVTTTDTKTCTATDNVQVTVNAAPTATAAATNVTCAGSIANSDGKITISGFTLGTDKYDYTTGATYSGSATYTTATLIPSGGIIVSNLPNPAVSQQYTVRIFSSSNSGCYIDRTVTLTNVNCTCPTITVSPTTAAACAGSANISYTQSGGATGGTWTIDSPASGGGSIVASTGVYTPPSSVASPTAVTIKYSEPAPSNCFGVRVITINPIPAAPTASVSAQPTCSTATGTITVTVPAPGAGITYTVTGTSPVVAAVTNSTGVFSGLAAGTYDVTTSENGCTSLPTSLTVNAQPATPTTPVIGTITQPTCALATGSVALSGLPASGTWTVTASPGGATITGTGTTATFSGLAANTYTFTVTNAAGCTSVASASATVNPQPTPPAAATASTTIQPTCAVATGTIVVTAPLGSFEYNIDGGAYQSSTTFSGVAAGSHTILVRSTTDNTCISAPASVTVNAQPTPPAAATASVTVQPTCTVATGTIVVTAPLGSFEYNIDGGAYQSSTTFSGVAAGSHTILVRSTTDNTCISAPASVTVNAQPATPTTPVIGTITQPTCSVATGSVALSGLPASGTWTVTASPGGATITGTGTTATFSGLAANTYTFTVTNAVGCTSVASASATINAQPATPTAPVIGTITQPTCSVATGSVALSGLPASGTWTVTASPGGATITGTGTTGTFSGLAANTYTFTVQNAAGCTSVASASATINPQPATPSITSAPATCSGTTYSITANATVASGTLEYSLDGGAYQSSNTFTGLASGSTHSVTVRTVGTTCTATMTGITRSCITGIKLAVIDPCMCNNDATINNLSSGTFSESIVVGVDNDSNGVLDMSLPADWTINVLTVTGASSGLVTGTTSFSMVNNASTNGFDALKATFTHVDNVGYQVSFEVLDGSGNRIDANGDFVIDNNDIITIANKCAYPTPAFNPALPASICAIAGTTITLGAIDNESGNPGGAATYTVNGSAATQLSTATAGTYTVVMQYTGANDASTNSGSFIDPTNTTAVASPNGGQAGSTLGGLTAPGFPGCIQPISTIVDVQNCCSPNPGTW